MFAQGFWFGFMPVHESGNGPRYDSSLYFGQALRLQETSRRASSQSIILAKGTFAIVALFQFITPEPGTSLLSTVPIMPQESSPPNMGVGLR